MDEFIWSGSDFPYMCLIDKHRTLTFKKAIDETVNAGDVVVDVGSGTGILAFFAAKAGAKKVYAVELDHLLAGSLRQSIELNGLGDAIEVLEQDALKANLPKNLDVVIAELIETGLMDEMQVKVMNNFHERQIIGPQTKLIPSTYETFVRLVDRENEFYGFKIAAPIHDWPFYSLGEGEWHQFHKSYLTEPRSIGKYNFQTGRISPEVNKEIEFKIAEGKTANALEISGLSTLSPNVSLGPANSYSGNKLLTIEPIKGPAQFKMKFSYKMSEGLGSFKAVRL